MTKILPCTCKHDYQDATHGAGQRVHNRCPGNNKSPGKNKSPDEYCCTVCSTRRLP